MKNTLFTLLLVLLTTLGFSQGSIADYSELQYFTERYGLEMAKEYIRRAYTYEHINQPNYPSALPDSLTDNIHGRQWYRVTNGGTQMLNTEMNLLNIDETKGYIRTSSNSSRWIYVFFDVNNPKNSYQCNIPKPDPSGHTYLRWGMEPNEMFVVSGNEIIFYDISGSNGVILRRYSIAGLSIEGRIAGGDGNDRNSKGDFLIANGSSNAFVLNIKTMRVITHNAEGERVEHGSMESNTLVDFPTFSLRSNNFDYATVTEDGFVFTIADGTYVQKYGQSDIREIYRRGGHADIGYGYLANGDTVLGTWVRYNQADAREYDGDKTQRNWAWFHYFPKDFITNPEAEWGRFRGDKWPGNTINSGGQYSADPPRLGITLHSLNGFMEYGNPWETGVNESVQWISREDQGGDHIRRMAINYNDFDRNRSVSYQSEGVNLPNGDIIQKTPFGWFHVKGYGLPMKWEVVNAFLNDRPLPEPEDSTIVPVDTTVIDTTVIDTPSVVYDSLPYRVSADSPQATFLVLLDSAEFADSAKLHLKILDPDRNDEGLLTINGSQEIQLFPGYRFDESRHPAIDIVYDIDRGILRDSMFLQFEWLSSLGYRVDSIGIELFLPDAPVDTLPSDSLPCDTVVVVEVDTVIVVDQQRILELQAALDSTTAACVIKDSTISELSRVITSKDDLIAALEDSIDQRDSVVDSLSSEIVGLVVIISQKDQEIVEKNTEIISQAAIIDDLRARIEQAILILQGN